MPTNETPLDRDSILGLVDITTKPLTVPDEIPVWGGRKLYIKQLSRGLQNMYSKRRSGNLRVKQDTRAREQEITGSNFFGHDSWLCINSICDAQGKLLFTVADETALDEKSGQAIGWIAEQILIFSDMQEDKKVQDDLETRNQKLIGEIKN